MKIALKASNGKYESAEQGGGLAYGDTVYKDYAYQGVATLYANRDEVGAWETFDLDELSGGYFSIKTCNGYFLTAEKDGGAGVSTNRTEVNAWEMFYIVNEGIQCH